MMLFGGIKLWPIFIGRGLLSSPSENDTQDRLRPGHALLLQQQFQRSITPAAGRHLEHAGFVALVINDRAYIQTLQQGALRDAFR